MQFTTTVTLLAILLNSAIALWVPPRRANTSFHPRPLWNHGPAKRNETDVNAGLLSGLLTLNILPNIVNPACGGIYEASITVESSPAASHLSPTCQNILAFMGGTQGLIFVDVILTCPAGSPPGVGSRDIEMVFDLLTGSSITGNGANGASLAAGTLEVISEKANTIITAQVNMGIQTTDSNPVMEYIYCN